MNLDKFNKLDRVEPFEEIDVYNGNNLLGGFITKTEGHYYGSLFITHINGMKSKDQFIQSSPKIKYPYDRNGIFSFRNVPGTLAHAYEKYDGTAIIAYCYEYRGKMYKTYKTRATAVTKSFELFNFTELWRKILIKYPTISEHVTARQSLVFELYGVKNTHLILYKVSLDAVLLFAIDRETEEYIVPQELGRLNFPTAKVKYTIKSDHDFPSYYNKIRGEIESMNEVTDKGIIGSEGVVIYVDGGSKTGGWIQYKCKPQSVMDVHCAPGLGRKDIVATVYNAFENYSEDEINYNTVKLLLMEEVTEREVDARKPLVEKCIEAVKKDVIVRKHIIDEYSKLDISIEKDKHVVMRHMSKLFEKKMMKYVYSIILSLDSSRMR